MATGLPVLRRYDALNENVDQVRNGGKRLYFLIPPRRWAAELRRIKNLSPETVKHSQSFPSSNRSNAPAQKRWRTILIMFTAKQWLMHPIPKKNSRDFFHKAHAACGICSKTIPHRPGRPAGVFLCTALLDLKIYAGLPLPENVFQILSKNLWHFRGTYVIIRIRNILKGRCNMKIFVCKRFFRVSVHATPILARLFPVKKRKKKGCIVCELLAAVDEKCFSGKEGQLFSANPVPRRKAGYLRFGRVWAKKRHPNQ